MTTPKQCFQCDGCGACCRSKLVDIYEVDILREPRISQHLNPLREPGLDGEIGYLDCICRRGCVFLDAESSCSIYPTRPSICVVFEPGSDDCQECRRDEGIPLLEPTGD